MLRQSDNVDIDLGVDRHSQRTSGACTLWRVAASMRPPEMLTPDETVQVDQALKKLEVGHFVDWPDLNVL